MSEPKAVTPIYTVQTLDEVTAQHIEHALGVYGWNMSRTALAIGIDRRTLYRMVERYGVKRPPELDRKEGVSHAT